MIPRKNGLLKIKKTVSGKEYIRIEIHISPALVRRLDTARGLVQRGTFIRELLDDKLPEINNNKNKYANLRKHSKSGQLDLFL